MKKITLFFIFAFTLLALFSQSLTVSYVNGYKILTGERPEISVRDFPVGSYEQGKIKIKLDRFYETLLPDIQYRADSENFVKTGIPGLDNLNAQFQARSYSPLFGTLYETNSKCSNFRDRHKAWGFHLWFTVELDKNTSIVDAVEAFQALPFVEIAEPFYKVLLFDADKKGDWIPDDPQLENQWHYNNTGQVAGTPGCDISLFEAWDIEKGNSEVIVSVVDCGINVNHPDLQANIWSGIGYNFYQSTSSISPGDHGCHTGGTIAAVTNNGVGVAGIAGGSGDGDGARLMTCQVFNSAGNSGSGFPSAYVYAADNGACISQNSWGYTSPNNFEQSVLTAIDYFIANGGGNVMQDGIVFFSSGNNNTGGNGMEGNYYPGCYAPVLGVTATNNQDKKSYYAHYGTWVGISAPGGETNAVNQRGVLSCTISSYAYYQGTSMACPHVSGTAALLVSLAARNGYLLSSIEIKDLLKNNADDHYALNPSFAGKLGTGRLNAYKALNALSEMLMLVQNPTNVAADPVSYSQIEISWKKNNDNHNVMLITKTDNKFTTPIDSVSYQVGDTLSEGEIVLFCGDDELFLHTGLSSLSTHYYKLFSYNEDYEYSKGVECHSTTLCGKIDSPLFDDFENEIDICWVQEQITGNSVWEIGRGNGGAYPNYAFEGEKDIYLRMRTASNYGDISRLYLSPIDMTDFNNAKISFALYKQSRSGLNDTLSVYYKTSDTKTWELLKTYRTDQSSWQVDTLTLPENVETEELQVCFEGKIGGGYGICLDNVSVEGYFRSIDTIGIKSNYSDNEISIFPNPTTGELTIDNRQLSINNVEIFDIYGRKQKIIINYQLSIVNSINISHLRAGMYFMKIITDTSTQTRKIIKI